MSARVRGHYRIDPVGHVMPLTDVNAAMKAYSIPLAKLRDRAAEQRSRIMKMCLAGLTIFAIAVGLMMALPQIERSVVAAQATRIASMRAAIYRNNPDLRPHHWHDRTAEN